MKLPSYSIAIRTLGLSGDKFVKELDSIATQTIPPERIIIYIAKGYVRPEYTIGREEYVEVAKGMLAQRALQYKEIDSEFILMLDDDVELSPNSAELLLEAAVNNNVDCVAADTFLNHKMSPVSKVYNALVNLTFPHYSKKWAFKILPNNSFSYNTNPTNDFYYSQSAAGPASLWRKKTFLQMNYTDELWIDRLGFSWGDDGLIFNKLYKNRPNKLGVLFNSGITHLDAKTQSKSYHANSRKFMTRSMASFIIWYRICYNLNNRSIFRRMYALLLYFIKAVWMIPIHIIASIANRDAMILPYYIMGQFKGLKFVTSHEYKNIPNFIVS